VVAVSFAKVCKIIKTANGINEYFHIFPRNTVSIAGKPR
jgi:hypothetical protein